MGISGLLPFVKAASSTHHLSDFKGQTVAIDSYCWLHRGAFGCAEKIAKGEHTTAYVDYCFKYIEMLLSFKIRPIMVFDGRHLPAKKLTETRRRDSRQKAKKKAVQLLKMGKLNEARSSFQRCVDIKPEMALQLIKECRRRNIDCIVAPYEADPQLSFLNAEKIVDFIISEDSDLLTYGCLRVLFKLNLSGTGTLVESDKLYLATKERPEEFTIDRFRHMCILSGCDYLDSLPGVGLVKALKFLRGLNESKIEEAIPKLPTRLNMPHITVTEEYIEKFLIADATFKHQLVFNPIKKCLQPLNDPDLCGTNPKHCCNAGEFFDNKTAYQLAIGNLNPFTLQPMDSWSPQKSNHNPRSIWNNSSITSYFKPKTTSTAFTKPECHSGLKRKNVTITSPVFKEILPACEPVADAQLLTIYSSQIEPPSKRTCIRAEHEDNVEPDDEKMSPILSGRKLNPFIRNRSNSCKRKINYSPEKTTNNKLDLTNFAHNSKQFIQRESEFVNNVEKPLTLKEKLKVNFDSTTNHRNDNEDGVFSKYFSSESSSGENRDTEEVVSDDEKDTVLENSQKENSPKKISIHENITAESDEKSVTIIEDVVTAKTHPFQENSINYDSVTAIEHQNNNSVSFSQAMPRKQLPNVKKSGRKNLGMKFKSSKQQTVLSMFGFTKV